MTVILAGRYEDNKSATSISYNQFGDTDRDQYPTFSICLTGDGLYQYNGSAIYEAYGINSANYEKMLLGQPAYRYAYDHTRRLFTKTSLSPTYGTHVKFDNIEEDEPTKEPFFDFVFESESFLDAKSKEKLEKYITCDKKNLKLVVS